MSGWQEWARGYLRIAPPTGLFIFMNIVLVLAAIAFARVGWRQAPGSLVIPAATFTNAVVFHIAPSIVQRHLAPGIYSAALLYVPISIAVFVGAARDGVPRSSQLTGASAGVSIGLSVVLVVRIIAPA
jgi:hypothetical protein